MSMSTSLGSLMGWVFAIRDVEAFRIALGEYKRLEEGVSDVVVGVVLG